MTWNRTICPCIGSNYRTCIILPDNCIVVGNRTKCGFIYYVTGYFFNSKRPTAECIGILCVSFFDRIRMFRNRSVCIFRSINNVPGIARIDLLYLQPKFFYNILIFACLCKSIQHIIQCDSFVQFLGPS